MPSHCGIFERSQGTIAPARYISGSAPPWTPPRSNVRAAVPLTIFASTGPRSFPLSVNWIRTFASRCALAQLLGPMSKVPVPQKCRSTGRSPVPWHAAKERAGINPKEINNSRRVPRVMRDFLPALIQPDQIAAVDDEIDSHTVQVGGRTACKVETSRRGEFPRRAAVSVRLEKNEIGLRR